ncbi:DUF3326 domain-containing protein [Synechococcus sp. MIT S9503]|uniref:DUF3326 domain-containing protein n=1 Tax=Synechococcus sp. MIT S9503 TaxID=3082547 RepID=UPI0039A76423
MTFAAAPLPTLMIVPTGIGCEVGGFAGDALPSARLLAAASGCLITHPNVINGASLYWRDPRIHYVEGYGLDHFASALWGLRPVRSQRIGLLLDAGIESDLLLRHRQVAQGCRATLGLDINTVVTTDAPLGVCLSVGDSGTSWGTLDRPDALLRAGERLKAAGATAIAVVARFPDDLESETLAAYRHGTGVDALAGAEAVISHLLVRHLRIPCAHAPALESLPPAADLDPRAAGEELGHTFLACVLVGLSSAPDLLDLSSGCSITGDDLIADRLGAVVVPDGALGGEAVLASLERGVAVIAVHNPGVLSVSADALGYGNQILKAGSYAEAAGLVTALREGIAIASLVRPLPAMQELK